MCAQTGCIPSKAVLHASEIMRCWSEAEGAASSQPVNEKANRLWRLARATRDESVHGMARETRELAGNT
jgi:pyruvate/2-oxoglutarate dehydrogenase complex dihydrolipoamide dehydrogenase (E3) component